MFLQRQVVIFCMIGWYNLKEALKQNEHWASFLLLSLCVMSVECRLLLTFKCQSYTVPWVKEAWPAFLCRLVKVMLCHTPLRLLQMQTVLFVLKSDRVLLWWMTVSHWPWDVPPRPPYMALDYNYNSKRWKDSVMYSLYSIRDVIQSAVDMLWACFTACHLLRDAFCCRARLLSSFSPIAVPPWGLLIHGQDSLDSFCCELRCCLIFDLALGVVILPVAMLGYEESHKMQRPTFFCHPLRYPNSRHACFVILSTDSSLSLLPHALRLFSVIYTFKHEICLIHCEVSVRQLSLW